jgi:hypothetical protein
VENQGVSRQGGIVENKICVYSQGANDLLEPESFEYKLDRVIEWYQSWPTVAGC